MLTKVELSKSFVKSLNDQANTCLIHFYKRSKANLNLPLPFPRTLVATTPKKENLESLMKIVIKELLMEMTLVSL